MSRSVRVLLVASFAAFFVVLAAAQSSNQPPSSDTKLELIGIWRTEKAEHVDGFPDIRAHKKGSLTLTADQVVFAGKAGSAAIPRSSVTAVSAGNQRVELWGMTGRLLRMAIPDNGGMAVAAISHHRVDMLTMEFKDSKGASHAAVFFLPANQASEALKQFALETRRPAAPSEQGCDGAILANSVLVLTPDWSGAHVPEAYQALVYEHAIERLSKAKGVAKVYRDGEPFAENGCPEYAVHLKVTGFTEGSSVKRAMLGPVGQFVGTTKMVFDADVTDHEGSHLFQEQLKSTMRGDSESTNIADHVAKGLVKKYEKKTKNKAAASQSNPAVKLENR